MHPCFAQTRARCIDINKLTHVYNFYNFNRRCFSLNFGRIIFNFDSAFYDLVRVSPIKLSQYIRSKWIFFSIATICYGIFQSILVIFYSPSKLEFIPGIILFILGFLNIYCLYLANFAIAAVDVNGGIFFSGTSKIFFIPHTLSVVATVSPYLAATIIQQVFLQPITNNNFLFIIIAPGLLSFVFTPIWLRKTIKTHEAKQYRNSEIYCA